MNNLVCVVVLSFSCYTRILVYKGWSIRDGFWGLVKFLVISRDEARDVMVPAMR